MKQPLIILTGPTAVGKTKASIDLAREIGGEIISADSVQVYKGMDIGSAKITPIEMMNITHHMVDILAPNGDFHVEKFQNMAKEAMADIYSRGNIPIIVGGTGFYIQALLYDIDFSEAKEDSVYRKELMQLADKKGVMYLHNQLRSVDSQSADVIHPNNIKRVIRALEYFKETNTPISQHNAIERQKKSPYNFAYFVLNDNRIKLYERINTRVDLMMAEGLLEEVKSLQQQGYTRDLVSMQGIGYKEIHAYLANECSLDDAIEQIKLNTRHFAKRQLTWFKREGEVIWINKDELGYDDKEINRYLLKQLKERAII